MNAPFKAPQSDDRQPIETAPRDGTPIRAFYAWDDGDEADEGVYYAEHRQCILGSRAGERGPGWVSPEIGHLPVEPTHWLPMNPQTPATSHPESYADYLALGMQKADKALPGGSAERKQDYAESWANSRAPVDVLRPPEPVARKSVRDVIASTLGEADAAQYKPSANPAPSLTALAESAREQRVFGMISEASRRYAAKGHQA